MVMLRVHGRRREHLVSRSIGEMGMDASWLLMSLYIVRECIQSIICHLSKEKLQPRYVRVCREYLNSIHLHPASTPKPSSAVYIKV